MALRSFANWGALAWVILILSACGGGGSSENLVGDSTNVQGVPVANAGIDQSVTSGLTVNMNAWESFDEDGYIVGFQWEQISGTPVTLTDAGSASTSFTVPSTNTDLTLIFRLTVTDNENKSSSDTVIITVTGQGSIPPTATLPEWMLHAGIEPTFPTVVGDRAYFMANGYELWITDGTTTGTSKIKDAISSFTPMSPFNGKLFFSANGGVWVSDGTTVGTVMLKTVTVCDWGTTSTKVMGVAGNYIYFAGDDGVNGCEVWVSDGTVVGTRMLADLAPGSYETDIIRFDDATVFNGKVYFWAAHTSATAYSAVNPEFYAADPTGVVQLSNSPRESAVLGDYDMIVFQGKLFFSWHTDWNEELWTTDGTVAGTQPFKDLDTTSNSGTPKLFHVFNNNTLLFFDYKNLWVSDGSAGGTQIIKQVEPAVTMDGMVMMNGKYYFTGRLSTDPWGTPYHLWSTDGTAAGTQPVTSMVQPDYSEQTHTMTALGNRLVFQGYNATNYNEPWVSDGSEAGTFLLKDLMPGAVSSYTTGNVKTGWMTVRGLKAYFVARVATDDFRLIETDGTTAGTKVIAPSDATVMVNPMGKSGFVSIVELPAPVLVGGKLLFIGNFHGQYTLYAI